MFQGGGVPRWGNIFVLACGNFFVSLSLRWGFDDDDDDRGGLGFYAGQLALESAIGGVGAPGGTAKGGTGPDDARDRHRRRSPGTDNTHGLRAVARQRAAEEKGRSDTEKPSGCMEAYRSVSLCHRTWRPFSWSRKAGPGRTPSERTTDGDGDGTGTGRFFHSYRGLGWVGGEVREAREGMIGGRQGEVR